MNNRERKHKSEELKLWDKLKHTLAQIIKHSVRVDQPGSGEGVIHAQEYYKATEAIVSTPLICCQPHIQYRDGIDLLLAKSNLVYENYL